MGMNYWNVGIGGAAHRCYSGAEYSPNYQTETGYTNRNILNQVAKILVRHFNEDYYPHFIVSCCVLNDCNIQDSQVETKIGTSATALNFDFNSDPTISNLFGCTSATDVADRFTAFFIAHNSGTNILNSMTSFRLALELLCYYLPKTQILVSSCQYTANEAYNQNAIKQFNAEQEKLCAELSIQYIPLYREMGINKVNHSTWLKNDNLHPNEDGEVLYTEYFRNRLNQNLVLRSGLYEVTAEANPAEGGEVTGAGTFNYGETITLSATANVGYTFINWTKAGAVVHTNPSYSFQVTGSDAYVANFTLNNYEITATANPTEGGTTTGSGTYNHGQQVTLTASANTGYHFVNWTENNTPVSDEVTYSFVVMGDRVLAANFELNSYVITAEADPAEGGMVTGNGTYQYGDIATVNVTPNPNYYFVDWTSNGLVVSQEPQYTFEVIKDFQLVANLYYYNDNAENDNSTFLVYPNPAMDKLFVKSDQQEYQCDVYSSTGTKVLSLEACSETIVIQLDKLSSDVYLIRLTSDYCVQTNRFVKL